MLKKVLQKMGLEAKGKVTTGKEAAQIINAEITSKSALTEQELAFILSKLRQAQYSGAEFEMFHNVWIKLSNLR